MPSLHKLRDDPWEQIKDGLPGKNRKLKRAYDKHLYKERNLVERLFNRLKNWRRVATRYDKT